MLIVPATTCGISGWVIFSRRERAGLPWSLISISRHAMSSLVNAPLPTWLSSPLLQSLGVSTYFPLIDNPRRVDAREAVNLWHDRVQGWLDALAISTQKPVIITEIGYRNTSDAGYKPFYYASTAPRDDAEQAILYNAALENVAQDPYIN